MLEGTTFELKSLKGEINRHGGRSGEAAAARESQCAEPPPGGGRRPGRLQGGEGRGWSTARPFSPHARLN